MPGVTQPAPNYQPYRPLPPLMGVGAPPKPSRGGLTSILAGILALVTAGLAVGATFAPITSYRNTYEGSGDTTVTANNVGWWGLRDAGSSSPFESESLLFGLALVLVAVLLVLGAVFAFVAARTRAAGATTGGRSLITAGVGVLAGVMLLESLQVMENASNYNSRELEPGESLEFSVGLGFVLPLCALGLGVIAVVLAHVGQRAVRLEPNTPRMGFPAPYGYKPGAPMGTPAAGVVAAGTPVAVGAPAAPAPGAELPTEVELGSSGKAEETDESGETTQVLSGATARGQEGASTAVTPPSGAPQSSGASETGDAATVAPADAAPVGAEPASSAPAASGPPATSEAPAGSDAPGASDAPTTSGATAAPEAPAAAPTGPGPAPLSDLPAAPPAPELSEEADKDGK
jgi:hypothetical protein